MRAPTVGACTLKCSTSRNFFLAVFHFASIQNIQTHFLSISQIHSKLAKLQSWFCLSRRRRSSSTTTTTSDPPTRNANMDLQVCAIIAVVFCVSFVSLWFINGKLRGGKTFEDVLAEKRSLADKLYGSKVQKKPAGQRKVNAKKVNDK